MIRALPRADAADLTAAQAYESVVHHFSDPDHHAYLVLAARRVADRALAADWERDAPHGAWWPEAALWRRTARNRLLRRHPGAVARVAAARPLGEHVVVSTDSEGRVAITGIADTESPDPAVVADTPVEAAVIAVVDAVPLDTRRGSVVSVDDSLPRTTALAQAEGAVVTGHDDGSVRWGPTAGSTSSISTCAATPNGTSAPATGKPESHPRSPEMW